MDASDDSQFCFELRGDFCHQHKSIRAFAVPVDLGTILVCSIKPLFSKERIMQVVSNASRYVYRGVGPLGP